MVLFLLCFVFGGIKCRMNSGQLLELFHAQISQNCPYMCFVQWHLFSLLSPAWAQFFECLWIVVYPTGSSASQLFWIMFPDISYCDQLDFGHGTFFVQIFVATAWIPVCFRRICSFYRDTRWRAVFFSAAIRSHQIGPVYLNTLKVECCGCLYQGFTNRNVWVLCFLLHIRG